MMDDSFSIDNAFKRTILGGGIKRADQLRVELNRLTTVHNFDPKDESTWPEEGKMFAACVYATHYKTHLDLSVYTLDSFIKRLKLHNLFTEETIALWSEHTPSLQAHLEKLKAE